MVILCVTPTVTVIAFVDVAPTEVVLPKSRVVEPRVSWLSVAVLAVPITPVLPHPAIRTAAVNVTERRSLRDQLKSLTSPASLAQFVAPRRERRSSLEKTDQLWFKW